MVTVTVAVDAVTSDFFDIVPAVDDVFFFPKSAFLSSVKLMMMVFQKFFRS